MADKRADRRRKTRRGGGRAAETSPGSAAPRRRAGKNAVDLVSVVVTTKNEEANLAPCLESLKCQTWPRIQIVVVDNASTDATLKIARRYTTHVFTKGPERSAQRNFGLLTASKGRYAMFLDADMIAAPNLVEQCLRLLRDNPQAVALHVGEVVLGSSFWCRVRRFERDFYDGTVIDGARFFHRDRLKQIGGFDPAIFAGEDWDLDKRLKQAGPILLLDRRPGNVPSRAGTPAAAPSSKAWPLAGFIAARGVDPRQWGPVIYHNESNFELSRYLAKKKYYTGSLEDYVKKWGAHDPDVRRQVSAVYRLFTVFLEHGRWKRIVRHPLLALGMYFLRFRVGWAWLTRTRSRAVSQTSCH